MAYKVYRCWDCAYETGDDDLADDHMRDTLHGMTEDRIEEEDERPAHVARPV